MEHSEHEGATRHALGGRLILAALAVLLLLNTLWMAQSCRQLQPVARGKEAPDFDVPLVNGGAFKLKDTRGKPVFVDFWATWCGPCKQSLPILDRVYQKHRAAGLQAIAVETDGAYAAARQFQQQYGLTMPIGLGDGEIMGRYGVSTIPHLVLIGKSGQVRRVFRGVHSEEELTRAYEEAAADAQ